LWKKEISWYVLTRHVDTIQKAQRTRKNKKKIGNFDVFC
jgi:hypothetical protein